MQFLKLSLAVCALLGYTQALRTKGNNFGDTLKSVEQGSKIDNYIKEVGKGGRADDYIKELGTGGKVDDFATFLKKEGAGDVGEYLKSLKGADKNTINYINGGGSIEDILKTLKQYGFEGQYSDYSSYLKDYKGDIPKKLVQTQRGINYDYTCEAQHLENCLLNDITIYGPNAVLINLDNSCQVDKIEREGIFLQTGDILFVTGREHSCAFQEWEEPCDSNLDYDVLFPGLDYDMPLQSAPGYKQEIIVLEAVGMGHTTYDIDLTWGGDVVRSVSVDVYVDQQPSLAVATPRHSC